MGEHPCPRCFVSKGDIHNLGTKKDMRVRSNVRVDNKERQDKINLSRTFIYEKGYVVNSQAVENLLKEQSLVPTKVRVIFRLLHNLSERKMCQNAFSKLAEHGLDFHKMLVPDFMHEIELGLHKNVLVHLVRILNSTNARQACVIEFDSRYVHQLRSQIYSISALFS